MKLDITTSEPPRSDFLSKAWFINESRPSTSLVLFKFTSPIAEIVKEGCVELEYLVTGGHELVSNGRSFGREPLNHSSASV